MRVVVQRVRSASVTVDGRTAALISRGLLVFVAVGRDDTQVDIDYIASKIRTLRLFEDNEGKMNRSLTDVGGAVLVVSEFTLFGDCRRGRRPSFDGAAPPSAARAVYDTLIDVLRAAGVRVEAGVFRAMMEVGLVNDGPVTVLLDSARSFGMAEPDTASNTVAVRDGSLALCRGPSTEGGVQTMRGNEWPRGSS